MERESAKGGRALDAEESSAGDCIREPAAPIRVPTESDLARFVERADSDSAVECPLFIPELGLCKPSAFILKYVDLVVEVRCV